jgi:hypothetical protein
LYVTLITTVHELLVGSPGWITDCLLKNVNIYVWIYKELRSVAGSSSGIPLPVTPKFKNNRKLAISKDEIQQSGYSV